jgi:hypothetical protein
MAKAKRSSGGIKCTLRLWPADGVGLIEETKVRLRHRPMLGEQVMLAPNRRTRALASITGIMHLAHRQQHELVVETRVVEVLRV